jgi:hypothetical protein
VISLILDGFVCCHLLVWRVRNRKESNAFVKQFQNFVGLTIGTPPPLPVPVLPPTECLELVLRSRSTSPTESSALVLRSSSTSPTESSALVLRSRSTSPSSDSESSFEVTQPSRGRLTAREVARKSSFKGHPDGRDRRSRQMEDNRRRRRSNSVNKKRGVTFAPTFEDIDLPPDNDYTSKMSGGSNIGTLEDEIGTLEDEVVDLDNGRPFLGEDTGRSSSGEESSDTEFFRTFRGTAAGRMQWGKKNAQTGEKSEEDSESESESEESDHGVGGRRSRIINIPKSIDSSPASSSDSSSSMSLGL